MARPKNPNKKEYVIPSRSSLAIEARKGPLAQAEKKIVIHYLVKNKGNILRTAYELFLNRNTLAKMINQYGIEIEKIREGRFKYDIGSGDKQGMLEEGSSKIYLGY